MVLGMNMIFEPVSVATTQAFNMLRDLVEGAENEADQKFEVYHGQQLIICPDCGKQVAYKSRCPKCGGASWIPAGHKGGITERMFARGDRRPSGAADAEA